MSLPGDTDLNAVCPYLGLADDAESHATFATEAHRCYRLPNPTRIASGHQQTYCLGANHPSCPVYQGEGVPQTTPTAGAAPRPPSAPPQPTGAVRGPAGPRQRPAPAGGRPKPPRQRGAGSLGPRPRAGGISMPAATIGLFALAIAIVALAFLIQRTLSDGGDGDSNQAQINQTQVAIWTQTAAAGGGDATPQPTSSTPGADQTPNGSETPGGDETPTPGDDATPGNGGGTTYIVQSGDFCGTIAEQFGITVEELIAANGLDENCIIFPDQELIIP